MKHHCGGEFVPSTFQVDIDVDGFSLPFNVDGLQCNKCGERIMSRSTVVEIESEVSMFRTALREKEVSTFDTQSNSFGYVSIPTSVGEYVGAY